MTKKIVTTTCVEHALIKIGFKKKKKKHTIRGRQTTTTVEHGQATTKPTKVNWQSLAELIVTFLFATC